MKTGRREVTILVIDSDQDSLAEVQEALSVEFTRIETASCLAEADAAMTERAADLVICEINAGCVEGDIFDLTRRSSWAAEILFLSAGQQAAVAFREFSGWPCFCVRKQSCRDLLLLIAKQALQPTVSQDSSADKVNRPNIPPPALTYPSVATNIHSLY